LERVGLAEFDQSRLPGAPGEQSTGAVTGTGTGPDTVTGCSLDTGAVTGTGTGPDTGTSCSLGIGVGTFDRVGLGQFGESRRPGAPGEQSTAAGLATGTGPDIGTGCSLGIGVGTFQRMGLGEFGESRRQGDPGEERLPGESGHRNIHHHQ
jgi:hypothetical protein